MSRDIISSERNVCVYVSNTCFSIQFKYHEYSMFPVIFQIEVRFAYYTCFAPLKLIVCWFVHSGPFIPRYSFNKGNMISSVATWVYDNVVRLRGDEAGTPWRKAEKMKSLPIQVLMSIKFEYCITCFDSLTAQNVLLGFRDWIIVYVISSYCCLGCYNLMLVFTGYLHL